MHIAVIFFFQAEDGIRDVAVTGVQTCALPITGVRTDAQEAWDKGQGVCQDMAQLTVALMRAAGLPARYVSGYLHPDPKAEPGSTAIGQSHAWVEYWAGEWTPLDPTSLAPVG